MSSETKLFSLRIDPEIRGPLEVAAERNGVTLTGEINNRLRRSIEIEAALGPSQNSAIPGILWSLASAMKLAGEASGFAATLTIEGANEWQNHPYAFDQAIKAVLSVLEALRPDGKIKLPETPVYINVVSDPQFPAKKKMQNLHSIYGETCANTIIEEAGSGFTRESNSVERARFLHRALGPLAKRLEKFCNQEFLKAKTHLGD